jgi:hypothetical protein
MKSKNVPRIAQLVPAIGFPPFNRIKGHSNAIA